MDLLNLLNVICWIAVKRVLEQGQMVNGPLLLYVCIWICANSWSFSSVWRNQIKLCHFILLWVLFTGKKHCFCEYYLKVIGSVGCFVHGTFCLCNFRNRLLKDPAEFCLHFSTAFIFFCSMSWLWDLIWMIHFVASNIIKILKGRDNIGFSKRSFCKTTSILCHSLSISYCREWKMNSLPFCEQQE